MKKILKVSALIAFIILITACNFFTTTWGSGLNRDNAEKLAQLTTDDLALLLTDPDYTSDPESIVALLDALGSKTPEEIQGLSVEDKQAILELTISAGVPISSLAGIMEQATSGDPGSALSELLSTTDVINVDAAAAVLTAPEMLETADPTVITAAAVTVLVQVVAAETEEAEDQDAAVTVLVNNITDSITNSPPGSTAEDIVDQMIADGSISEGSREEMIAITTAMQVLSGTSSTGIDRSGGGSPLDGLLP